MAPKCGTSLVVVLSDLHFGKDTAHGYTIDEASRRIASLHDKLKDHPGLFEFDEIRVLLGGDIVEGEGIYPSQAAELNQPVLQHYQMAEAALWKMASGMRKRWPLCEVIVDSVPGNHGRQSPTAHPSTNWDNAVYYSLATRIQQSGDAMLKMDPGYAWIRELEIAGARGLLYHFGIKHVGTPAMQIKLVRWLNYYGADFLVHGHWHTAEFAPVDEKWRIANGCLCGPDELSDRMAAYSPPRQVFFGINNGKIFGFNFLEW